jgi:serine/threonine protein kinase
VNPVSQQAAHVHVRQWPPQQPPQPHRPPQPAHAQPAQLQAARAVTTATSESDLCTLCCNEPRTIRFRPCMHHMACRDCARRLRDCPICRAQITSLEDCDPRLPTLADTNAVRRPSQVRPPAAVAPAAATANNASHRARELSVEEFNRVSPLGHSDLLGAGGFGSVYRGTLNGRPVAVKVPNPSTTRNTTNFSDVYRSELELLLRIRHDHVVPLVAYCTARSALIFPLLTPLTDILNRVDIASVLHDALRGIAYIHESGHVHRDVKLANILLDDNQRAMISDLGIARFLTAGTHATTGRAGTWFYMDPNVRNGAPARPEHDMYAFGVTIAAAFAGQEPISDDNVRQLVRAIRDDTWRYLAERCIGSAAQRPSAQAALAVLLRNGGHDANPRSTNTPTIALPQQATHQTAAGSALNYDQLANLSNVAVPLNNAQRPPTVVYTSTTNEGSCGICLDEMRPDVEVRILPCGHTFHSFAWILGSINTTPALRAATICTRREQRRLAHSVGDKS